METSTAQLAAFEKEVERKGSEADVEGPSLGFGQMATHEIDGIEHILHNVAEERERLKIELKADLRVKVLGDPNFPAAVPTCPD